MEISDWGMENHVQGSGKLRSKARDTGGGGECRDLMLIWELGTQLANHFLPCINMAMIKGVWKPM